MLAQAILKRVLKKWRVGIFRVKVGQGICRFVVLLLGIGFGFGTSAASEAPPLIQIALDADRTRHGASARSIEMGIKTAFSEVGNRVQNFRVEFMVLDHRGNSTRSKLNMTKAFANPETLLVVAGLHSPPLIRNRSFINENKMLTLVPWAAGGPITRYPSADNWVFRLSIDDTKAGIKIAEYAVNIKNCRAPHLLLEQTPWGESNRSTMERAINDLLAKTPSQSWFNWGVSKENLRIKLRAIVDGGADCILFVGNADDGETLMHAMLSMKNRTPLPVLSHWGITGGIFHQNITSEMRAQLDLAFIQTCFSFVSSEKTLFSEAAFLRAKKLFPELKDEQDLEAPAGFIHAYDFGRILIQALSQIDLSGDMQTNRMMLKFALEHLSRPVQGLIKLYDKPFSTYSSDNDDAHEALNLDDFCMAHYGQNNEIKLLPTGK